MTVKRSAKTKLYLLLAAAAVIVVVGGYFAVNAYLDFKRAAAFSGPTQGAGQGSGAIASDSAGNLAVGISATLSGTKFLTQGSTADTSAYAFRARNSAAADLLTVRNDGLVTIPGTLSAGTISGLSVSANVVTPGAFNSAFGGGGNYSFPAAVGIGTASPSAVLQVNNVGSNSSVTFGDNYGSTANANSFQFLNYSDGNNYFDTKTKTGGRTYFRTGQGTELNYARVWMTVDATTGNVGIGTTAPGEKLDVTGNVRADHLIGGGTGADPEPFSSKGAVAGYSFDDRTGGNSERWVVYSNRTGGAGTNTLRFWSGGDKMVITAGGNVGVGTTGPGYKLDIQGGQINASGGLCIGGSCITSWAGASPWTTSGSSIYNTNSGNVGIGTASPGQKLDVMGNLLLSGNRSVIFTTGDNTASHRGGLQILTYNNGVNTILTPTDQNGNPINSTIQLGGFGNFNSNVINLAVSGNVGIGTTAPGAKLEVNGDIKLSPANPNIITGGSYVTIPNGLYVSGGTPYFQTQIQARAGIHNDSAAYLEIDGGTSANTYFTGNVGIGTTGPSQKLEVAGNTSSTQFCLNGTCISSWSAAGGLNGGGTVNYVGKFTAANTVGNSQIFDNGTNVGIGTASPGYKLDVNGDLRVQGSGIRNSAGYRIVEGNATDWLRINPDASWLNGTAMYGNVAMGTGGLSVGSWGTAGAGNIQTTGNVTVGGNLTVGGGSGKITAGSFDPVYNIGGAKYATYLPGITGQKEETAGTVTLVADASGAAEASLDFGGAPQGSDLWLFRRVIDASGNFDKVSVLLTSSFDGRVWYVKDAAHNRIEIYGSSAGEVSYRLTGARFDAALWPNLYSDQTLGGMVVPSQ